MRPDRLRRIGNSIEQIERPTMAMNIARAIHPLLATGSEVRPLLDTLSPSTISKNSRENRVPRLAMTRPTAITEISVTKTGRHRPNVDVRRPRASDAANTVEPRHEKVVEERCEQVKAGINLEEEPEANHR